MPQDQSMWKEGAFPDRVMTESIGDFHTRVDQQRLASEATNPTETGESPGGSQQGGDGDAWASDFLVGDHPFAERSFDTEGVPDPLNDSFAATAETVDEDSPSTERAASVTPPEAVSYESAEAQRQDRPRRQPSGSSAAVPNDQSSHGERNQSSRLVSSAQVPSSRGGGAHLPPAGRNPFSGATSRVPAISRPNMPIAVPAHLVLPSSRHTDVPPADSLGTFVPDPALEMDLQELEQILTWPGVSSLPKDQQWTVNLGSAGDASQWSDANGTLPGPPLSMPLIQSGLQHPIAHLPPQHDGSDWLLDPSRVGRLTLRLQLEEETSGRSSITNSTLDVRLSQVSKRNQEALISAIQAIQRDSETGV